jgi:hypothetical protein
MKHNHARIVKQTIIVFLSSILVVVGLFSIFWTFAPFITGWPTPAVRGPSWWLGMLLGVLFGVALIYGGIRLFKDIRNP